jgi:hypothetical protein
MDRAKNLLLLALTIGVVLFAASCSDGNNGVNSDMGQVQFVMSSTSLAPATGGTEELASPGEAGSETATSPLHHGDGEHDGDATRLLEQANITFSSILARNLDGELIDVSIDLPVTVDMLAMVDQRTVSLPMGFLPPGTYDQIVVVMTEVELVTHDGTQIAITPPGGGWTAIIRVCPFTVDEGAMTTVRLRFHRRLSFGEYDGGFRFHPYFECEEI